MGEYGEAIDQLITCCRVPHLSPSTGCAPTVIWDPLRGLGLKLDHNQPLLTAEIGGLVSGAKKSGKRKSKGRAKLQKAKKGKKKR